MPQEGFEVEDQLARIARGEDEFLTVSPPDPVSDKNLLPPGEVPEPVLEHEEDLSPAGELESILEMPSGYEGKSGARRKKWRLIAIFGGIIGCTTTVWLGVVTGLLQKLIAKPFGANPEARQKELEIIKSGEELVEDFVKLAEKQGTDFGEDFKMDDAKEQGAAYMERTYSEMGRLFDEDNQVNKVEPRLVDFAIVDPLPFESSQFQGTDFNRVFNVDSWSISQKLFMESLAIAAQEQGIDPNNGGLERWLVANGKDSVYAGNISGAHLLQLLWNEYQSGDNLPISTQDQQLLLQYWQATGRKWLTPEGKIETQHKMSWTDIQAIFDMASQSGSKPEEVLGSILTLQAELTTSQAGAEAKALEMAQVTAGAASVDSIGGALMGIMVVFGIGRPRLWELMHRGETTVNEKLRIVTEEGKKALERIRIGLARPEISEEQRRLENSRRLVNRLRHGLSLSREVMQDVGAMLVDPNNQDMKDLLETEGANWFRHVPETHPEINQIMGFFGCQNFRQLQELGQYPEQIVDRLHEVFKTGRRTSHKTQNRQILDLISLYYQASRKVDRQ